MAIENVSDEELSLEIKKKAILGMLADFQQKVGLDHWDIEILFSKYTPNHGSVDSDKDNRRATIIINVEDDIKEIRKTILHELFHIIIQVAYDPLAKAHQAVFDKMIEQSEEQICRLLEGLVDEK